MLSGWSATQFHDELLISAAEHARLLNTSLDDTRATLQPVNAQLASLLASAS